MHRLRARRADLLALAALVLLPLLWFLPELFPAISGRTLLPWDNLYQFEPWRSMQPDIVPDNALLSDLVLQNVPWKLHIRRSLALGELPLWNPQIFTGLPFLAAGQASTFYPLNVLFYVLPLDAAYGWFTALHIAIAGVNTFLFARVLRLQTLAALFSGVAFQFSGFLIVSVVFTMFLAAAVWLPLLLAIIEFVIRKQEDKGVASFQPIPYVVAGAAVIGLVVLAGHPELLYYTMLVAGGYTAARLIVAWEKLRKERLKIEDWEPDRSSSTQSLIFNLSSRRIAILATWLLTMALLGLASGAIQLVPLLELLPLNFRGESASLADVLDWAWPSRHVVTFALPDVFGNPSHHRWFDLWAGEWRAVQVNSLGEPIDTITWGIKNYVEGGNYLGIATWILAAVAVLRALASRGAGEQGSRGASAELPTSTLHSPLSTLHTFPTVFFAALALLSLLFAFGTPLYVILYKGLPGWEQLHSPFRWVYPFTLSMVVLAGIGLDELLSLQTKDLRLKIGSMAFNLRSLIFLTAILIGFVTLAVVATSYVLPNPFISLSQRLLDSSEQAQRAFADGRMFWSYQALGLLRFGVFTVVSGALLLALDKVTRRQGDKVNQRRLFTPSPPHLVTLSLLALLALDLYAIHGNFNPSTPVELSPLRTENVPSVVEFINQREASQQQKTENEKQKTENSRQRPWRFITFDVPGQTTKTFNANAGMYYGWQDIRGYDSIIPSSYVDAMSQVAEQGDLLYNRIAPLYAGAGGSEFGTLGNPWLDLLNVKYVLTESRFDVPGWQEIYRDDAIAVYENEELLDRAFLLPSDADPATLTPGEVRAAVNNFAGDNPSERARVSLYEFNDVLVDINAPQDNSTLVLTDAWFPGWKAYLRPFGMDEGEEIELPIEQVYENFRAVEIPEAGQWTVRFVYAPRSFQLGLYASFLSAMALLLLLGYWAWGRWYRPEASAGEVRTVAKNSLVPMGLSLSNKAIDFAFAMLYVRLLGPEGTGKYYFVVALYGFFEIISRYGLGTLLTRDVAADKNQSSRYLSNVIALRTGLWLAALPLLALVTFGYWVVGGEATGNVAGGGLLSLRTLQLAAIVGGATLLAGLFTGFDLRPSTLSTNRRGWVARAVILAVAALATALVFSGFVSVTGVVEGDTPTVQSIGIQEVQAIALLAAAMLFANWADALSATFHAFEKMEYPAGLTSAIALLKVTLGALVLLLGWGFVGLAGVSLVVNILQVGWLYGLVRSTLFAPQWRPDGALQRSMLRLSGPLMLNHLLATIFWRIDIWILRPLSGAAAVGLYSVGIKYLDGLNIIPSVFTMAIFPLMARLARDSRDGLLRSYTLSVRVLLILSLPIALSMTALAGPLVWLVGGTQYTPQETVLLFGREISYLGGSALALQVIIWSIPIGFVNSVTQFVLIAVNQQRYLTKAFIIGVVFNTVGNLLLIPRLGYIGAALVTIFSEFSLLFPFYWSVRQHVGVVPWRSIVVAPTLALLAMTASVALLIGTGTSAWLAVPLGWVVYVAALVATGAFRHPDFGVLWRAVPIPALRRRLPVG